MSGRLAQLWRNRARPIAVSLLRLVATLLGLHALLFVLFSVMGDPARMLVGQRADQGTLAAIRHELGLDRTLGEQYLLQLHELSPVGWLDSAGRAQQAQHLSLVRAGEHALVLKLPYLRRSFQSSRPVGALIAERIPATALLALASLLIAAGIGIPLGVFAARNRDGWADRLSSLASVVGVAAPSFFAAIVMATVFAVWLEPVTGLNVTGYIRQPSVLGEGYVYTWANLILPAATLGLRPAALLFQITRSGMIEVLSSDYVRTAWAKGLPERVVVWRHALPNVMGPVLTVLSGWLAALFTGAFFVEAIFDWPGLGKLIVDALLTSDYPVISGACLVTGAVFVGVLALTDRLQGLVDPRVRA